jgi:hypothetical protein
VGKPTTVRFAHASNHVLVACERRFRSGTVLLDVHLRVELAKERQHRNGDLPPVLGRIIAQEELEPGALDGLELQRGPFSSHRFGVFYRFPGLFRQFLNLLQERFVEQRLKRLPVLGAC